MRIKNQPFGDKVFDFSVYFILIAMFLVVAYPLWFIIIASISDPTFVNGGEVWFIPKGIMFSGYKMILKDARIWSGYLNTIIYSVGYTVISATLSLTIGYALSKKYLFGRRFFNIFFITTMYFTGGLIPLYILVLKLGLNDKFYTLWFINSLVIYHVIIARTFFQTSIPEEICESASIDGCNQAQTFFKIVLPLSKAIIAVIVLYCLIMQWNGYFLALVFLSSADLKPLQLVLKDILISSQNLQDSMSSISDYEALAEQEKLADLIRYGMIIVSSAPLLMLYPFLQKYFVKGMLVGSVKG